MALSVTYTVVRVGSISLFSLPAKFTEEKRRSANSGRRRTGFAWFFVVPTLFMLFSLEGGYIEAKLGRALHGLLKSAYKAFVFRY